MIRLTRKNSQTAIPLTIIAGAVIGCAATLLLAPKKGSESRKWLNNRLDDLKTGLSKRMGNQLTAKGNQRTTMHPLETFNMENKPVSKAASMVNHLKEHKKNDHRQDGHF